MRDRILIFLGALMFPAWAFAQFSPGAFTGNNNVTVQIEQSDRIFAYGAHNMIARLNVNQEQFEFQVPDNEFYNTDSSENMDLFLSLMGADTTRAPLSITLEFLSEQVRLEDFEGQPVTFRGNINFGEYNFELPVEVKGYYKDNVMVMDFFSDINGNEASTIPYGITSIQIAGEGVRIQNITDQ